MNETVMEWICRFDGEPQDWRFIKKVFPDGWEEQARELGAFTRKHGIRSPADLMRVMLMHLSEGYSLRQTAVRAKESGLCEVSDVALLKRLRHCQEWFCWIHKKLITDLPLDKAELLPGRQVRLVDGSVVCEPGAKETTWRIHYSIDLSSMACDEALLSSTKEGETLTRFSVKTGDVLIGDRGFAHRRGIRHVIKQGGDVIVRLNLQNVPLETESGEVFNILQQVRTLNHEQTGHWRVQIRDTEGVIPAQLCVFRKSVEATQKAQDRLRKDTQKKRQIKPETLEAAGYVFVLTTLKEVPSETVLELYRARWQIELAFKRLKSLLRVGHLKKKDPIGAKAWLQGKLLVAALIEKLIALGKLFSPQTNCGER